MVAAIVRFDEERAKMGSRGWEKLTQSDVARLQQRGAAVTIGKPAKYRNRTAVVGDQKFDSEKEAQTWIMLSAREQRGEITNLRRQVPYPLYAPTRDADGKFSGLAVEISRYCSDFDYYENGRHIVHDAKGQRTRRYLLKRKWLELQEGIVIRES